MRSKETELASLFTVVNWRLSVLHQNVLIPRCVILCPAHISGQPGWTIPEQASQNYQLIFGRGQWLGWMLLSVLLFNFLDLLVHCSKLVSNFSHSALFKLGIPFDASRTFRFLDRSPSPRSLRIDTEIEKRRGKFTLERMSKVPGTRAFYSKRTQFHPLCQLKLCCKLHLISLGISWFKSNLQYLTPDLC